jgi:hypothetical protein
MGANPMKPFKLHKYLNYQGYSFPWYVTVIWITFFVAGVIYLIRHLLF